MEISMEFPQKPRIELSYDPSVPPLDIYLTDSKSTFDRDTYTLVSIVILVTIANKWNPHR